MVVPEAWRSRDQGEERLAFLDDVGGQFGGVAAADVLTAWTTPAGTVKASPALHVLGG
jgi:hypothetical protein